jgi:hypothetical protein
MSNPLHRFYHVRLLAASGILAGSEKGIPRWWHTFCSFIQKRGQVPFLIFDSLYCRSSIMIALLDSTNLIAPTLEPKLHERLPGVGLEIFSLFETLQQRLSSIRGNSVIAILTVDNHSQLERFRVLQKLYVDMRIVLILPDHEPETIHLGHQLYPRYVSYKDGNFDDLVAVVVKMHQNMQPFPGF